MYRALRNLLLLALAVALASCRDGGLLTPQGDPSLASGGNGHYLRDLDTGQPMPADTAVEIADVLFVGLAAGNGNGPQNNKNVQWTSSNPAVVALVPDRGRATLTALSPGTSVVSAKLGGNTVSVTIHVAAPPPTNTPPVAVTDVFQAIGNFTTQVAAPGVLANDTDADSDPLTAVPGTFSSLAGGTVTMNADGSFTYLSPAGFSGVDSFSYQVTDGTDTATGSVAITIGERVWYVDNSATAPGDGRDASPFTTLAAAEAASAAGESIFVLEGDGTSAGMNAGITLKAGQSLIGEGIMSPVTRTVNAGTVVLLSPGGVPVITSGSGATVQLATGNTVRGLDIESAAGAGIAGSAYGTFTASESSVAAVGGPALQLSNGQVTASFTSLSSDGGANGIFIDGAVAGSSLTVIGGATLGTGGTIENASGVGVLVNGPATLSLSRMRIRDNGGRGVHATGLAGFTLASSEVSGNGATGVELMDATGSASITGTTFTGAAGNNLAVRNGLGTVNLSVSGSSFANAAATADAFLLEGTGAGVQNATVQSNTFTSAGGNLFLYQQSGAASGDVTLSGNSFSNNHPSIVPGAGRVVLESTGGTTSLDYAITGNTFRDASGSALAIQEGNGIGTLSGTISGNTIGVAGVPNSGSTQGSGISLTSVGGGSHVVAVSGNQVRQYNNQGILLQIGDASLGGNGSLDATVTGNVVAEPGTVVSAKNGVHLNAGTITGDNPQVCLDLGGVGALANSITGSGSGGPAGTDFRLRQRMLTTVRLPGYVGANNDNAAVTAYVQARNGGTPTGLVQNTVPTGGGYTNGSCLTPGP